MKTIYIVLCKLSGTKWETESDDWVVKGFNYQDSAIQFIKDNSCRQIEYRIEEVEYE